MWGKGIEMKLSVSIFFAIVSTVVAQGILEEACSQMLKKFFIELRERNKMEKEARKANAENA